LICGVRAPVSFIIETTALWPQFIFACFFLPLIDFSYAEGRTSTDRPGISCCSKKRIIVKTLLKIVFDQFFLRNKEV